METQFARVRPAADVDAERIAEIFARSWTLAYTGIIPRLQLEGYIRRRRADWWARAARSGDPPLLLEAGGVIAGYATCGRSRARQTLKGEIYELYLDPVYQGLGLGVHLFESCRQVLDERGLEGLLVWALCDNRGACEFYRRRGGRPVGEALEQFGDTTVAKMAFGWS